MSDSPFDLGAIRNMLEKDDNTYLKGVNNRDVDWFLRDSNILPSQPMEPKNTSISPHLQTPISNTNANSTTKTKPSISPIHEDSANLQFSDVNLEKLQFTPILGRRKSSISSLGSNSSSGSGPGFLSKLKEKFHRPDPAVSPPPQKPSTPPVFKENYDLRIRRSNTLNGYSSPSEKEDLKLSRTLTSPTPDNSSDPRLNEYIKFYQQKDLRRNSLVSSYCAPPKPKVTTYPPGTIPSHPQSSPLPGALVNGTEPSALKVLASSPVEPAAKFGFLRRKSVSTHVQSESASLKSSSPPPEPLPEFKGLKPLKSVAFHSLTFLIDPPQQIPSRNPRKGNVETLPNGTIKIHPLTEEDKVAMEKSQMGQGGGLVVGGTGALGLIRRNEDDESEKDEANELSQSSKSTVKCEEDAKLDPHAKRILIEKPVLMHHGNYSTPVKKMALDLMYSRCCHLREILPIPAIMKQIPKGSMAPLRSLQLRNPTPTMVEIQTFADFIRIAPVLCVSLDGVSLSLPQFKLLLSAMSSKTQMEKLSLRNTPIDHEGWLLLCWFLSRNKTLNRLDITQCPSLSVNLLKKKKRKLSEDKRKEEDLVRMTCNKENRSDMDWALFTATIIARGGIEELILTGCCISDLAIFEKFIKLAVSLKTYKLGLAYNQLTLKQLSIVAESWMLLDFVRGIDLGYNDFSSLNFVNIMLSLKNQKGYDGKLARSSLAFLSLNATNIRFTTGFKEMFETIIMRLPSLKYLDLSNNERLFGYTRGADDLDAVSKDSSSSSILSESPSLGTREDDLSQESIVSYFSSMFPLFPKLIRLHLENDRLLPKLLVSIAKILPFCKNLGYISVVGNDVDITAGAALIQALKNSKTLITLDCDYEKFPDLFKERIGLYTMRNMERLLYLPNNVNGTEDKQDVVLSLNEQLNEILSRKADNKLDLTSPEVIKFIDKARSIRLELKAAMDELLRIQWKNELNLEGKETLIRFLFIDASIEKGLQLIDNLLVPEVADKNKLKFSEDGKIPELMVPTEVKNINEPHASGDSNSDSHEGLQVPSPMVLLRSQSKSSLNTLNRQEGSMLKLLKLRDFHVDSNRSFFDDLSGEEIRKKLLNVDFADLDKIILYLGELKEKGISIGNVFNTTQKADKQCDDDALDIDLFRRKLEILGIKKAEGEDNKAPEGKSEGEGNSDVISQAFDQVLNGLL